MAKRSNTMGHGHPWYAKSVGMSEKSRFQDILDSTVQQNEAMPTYTEGQRHMNELIQNCQLVWRGREGIPT